MIHGDSLPNNDKDDDDFNHASRVNVDVITFPSPEAIWKVADEHGWHNPGCNLPTDLLLIHSEVSEACEAARRGDMGQVGEELADVIIRVLHTCAKHGIAIGPLVKEKHQLNKQRPYRHGGKLF